MLRGKRTQKAKKLGQKKEKHSRGGLKHGPNIPDGNQRGEAKTASLRWCSNDL